MSDSPGYWDLGSVGVPPAFLQRVESGKIASEMPALLAILVQ
jgi:hypothetical protein